MKFKNKCQDCWHCDCFEYCAGYGCYPELRIIYGIVSNNYRKMHGFPLLRKKHIKMCYFIKMKG